MIHPQRCGGAARRTADLPLHREHRAAAVSGRLYDCQVGERNGLETENWIWSFSSGVSCLAIQVLHGSSLGTHAIGKGPGVTLT